MITRILYLSAAIVTVIYLTVSCGNSPLNINDEQSDRDIDFTTEMMLATEHGPSTEQGCCPDEINIIEKSDNYGRQEILGDEEAIQTYGQQKVTVKLHLMIGYEGYEAFANSALQKLEDVINSETFMQEVLNGNFTETKELSNQEIYDLIIKAQEVQGPGGDDNVIDLRIRTMTLEQDGKQWMKTCELNSREGTIGIDGQADGVTAICPQRLELWGEKNYIASLAGHYAHEYMHILGFSHWDFNKRKSLVYKIGDIVEKLINEGDKELPPAIVLQN